MRQLKINLSDLEDAFDSDGEMLSYYLDTETGEIILITEEIRGAWESISESYYDEETQTIDWEKAFEAEQTPDWMREGVQAAEQVEAGFGSRIIAIPAQDSHEGYRDMEDFNATVGSPRLQERLERAISGRGAFRNFKNVLLDHPAERERWFKFKDEQVQQRMLDWLEAQGIEPIPDET